MGTVWGSEKVLAQALDFRPQVILLDLDTSDRTGLATIADLRAALPEASLIALSCWAPTVTGRQCWPLARTTSS